MMWGTDYGFGGWAMMIGSLVVGVIVIAAVVVGVVWLVRSQQSVTPVGPGSTTAQAILDARYARGEIDESELTRARQLLATQPPDARPKS
ncbi:MAG TPA: SHOCT domain-containing protein [Candidatus Saccharimonadales bacterium]|jgi:putative membrane protein|nr:SHOCT domain-containing protein [Candidatus Saccharimonadales bacterium]